MKELSLNILDISENSTKAKATLVEILIDEKDDLLSITIKDNGTGMTDDILSGVTDPFCTTRTTRKVGMGLPLFKFAAEQTGGSLSIESKHFSSFPDDHGTTVTAVFYKNHIDFTPLGDLPSTVTTLIQGHPDVDFVFHHKTVNKDVSLDTRELREVLDDVPLDSFEILIWIKDSLNEQYDSI